MAFWQPGARLAPKISLWEADCDAEQHAALPSLNSQARLPLSQQRSRLPIAKHRLELLYAAETHRAIVLCGPTGCGKSTQLPQYLHEAGWTKGGYVVGVTQPRRVAAVSIAARIAEEMGVELGREVGYHVRFDRCVTPGVTQIQLMTEGILMRDMLSDPLLTRFSVLVIDEAHERSTDVDLLLGLLKKIQRKRPHLRVIMASATADAEALLQFFARRKKEPPPKAPERKRPRSGWDDQTGEFQRQFIEDKDWRQLCQGVAGSAEAPKGEVCLVNVKSRLHDVSLHYLEEPAADYLRAAVEAVVALHQGREEGDILAFLTGQEEVNAACSMIKELVQQCRERAADVKERAKLRPLSVLPLYGALPFSAQAKAIAPSSAGTRKAVISTNVAESSVTIDGVVFVVDACFAKVNSFCPKNGASYLNVVPCSRSSARQRAGRAGRTRPGHCFRLLTEKAFRSSLIPQSPLPELARADLKDPVLLLKCLGVDDVGAFEFITAPSREAVEVALEDLFALGALDAEARVVEPLAPRMIRAPLPLGLSRLLLLSAEEPYGCSAEAAAACAMLMVRQPWLPANTMMQRDRLKACKASFAAQEGDLVAMVNVLRQAEEYLEKDHGWAGRHSLDEKSLRRAFAIEEDLKNYLQRMQLPLSTCGENVEQLQRAACGALFLNAAKRLPHGAFRLCRALGSSEYTAFQLHADSSLASVQDSSPADYIVFVDALCTGNEATLQVNTRIESQWLTELAPHYFEHIPAGRARPERL